MTSTVQVVIFVGRILLYLPFLVVAGTFPLIIEQWGVSATQAGSIVSAFYLSYAFSLFVFSWLCDWWGAKRAASISIVATALTSVAFAVWAVDYWSTLVTYALIGAGHGGIYTPLVILLRQNIPPDKLGTAVGWLVASTSTGYALSIGVAGLCIYLSGWRLAFQVAGLASVLGAALLLLALAKVENRVSGSVASWDVTTELRENRESRTLLGGYVGHCWELLGMWAWAPAFLAANLVLHGNEVTAATQISAGLITLLHIVGAVAALIMGGLSDKIGRKPVLLWNTALAAGFSFTIGWLVHIDPYVLFVLMLAYSFFAIGDSSVLSTTTAERVNPNCLGALLAIRSLLGFIAGAASPVVFGLTIDWLRALQATEGQVWGAAFATLGIAGAAAAYFSAALKGDRRAMTD
ncbi:MAG: MFS transporter [Pseudomonadota bacterium]